MNIIKLLEKKENTMYPFTIKGNFHIFAVSKKEAQKKIDLLKKVFDKIDDKNE